MPDHLAVVGPAVEEIANLHYRPVPDYPVPVGVDHARDVLGDRALNYALRNRLQRLVAPEARANDERGDGRKPFAYCLHLRLSRLRLRLLLLEAAVHNQLGRVALDGGGRSIGAEDVAEVCLRGRRRD